VRKLLKRFTLLFLVKHSATAVLQWHCISFGVRRSEDPKQVEG
jgi:hypothetical protein